MNIFVVFGSSGEYSDRNEWMVCAFRSEEAAQKKVTELTEKMQELGVTQANHQFSAEWYDLREEATAKMRQLDENFYMDYTGTSYYIAETNLIEE